MRFSKAHKIYMPENINAEAIARTIKYGADLIENSVPMIDKSVLLPLLFVLLSYLL